MGSSCSSGPKKDKCSKKKKAETNGANHSHRESNASNSSVYAYQKAAAEGEVAAAGGEPSHPRTGEELGGGAAVALVTAATTEAETPLPTPMKPKVERTDSHSAVSVSSPMSPTQLLRQTSKEGDQDVGMGRIDLLSVPDYVRHLITGHLEDVPPFSPSARAVRIVSCRYGEASRIQAQRQQQDLEQQQGKELEALEANVFETLRLHCAQRGYELETLNLDEDALQEDWDWVLSTWEQPLTLFLMFVSECTPPSDATRSLPRWLPFREGASDILDKYYERDDNAVSDEQRYVLRRDDAAVLASEDDIKKLRKLYPQETRTGWQWMTERICSESRLCRRTVCIWRRLLQSPYPTTALQQRMLESVDESRLVKCNLKWQEDLNGGVEPEAHQCYVEDLCAQLYPILTLMLESVLDDNEVNDPTTLGLPSFIGVSRRLHSELIEHTQVARELFETTPKQGLSENAAALAVRNYLQSDDAPWPLIVHGGAGSGKSRIVATAVHYCCSQWLPNAHVVFRFAHQTPESQSVDRLLISVIEQCCLLLGEPRPSGVQAADLPGLLQRLAPVRPLVVLLDGLDSIVPSTSSSSTFQWLPTILPDNVRLVLTVTNPSPLYDHLCSVLPLGGFPEAGFVAVSSLTENLALELLLTQLRAKGRTLIPRQQEVCLAALQKLPNPTYVSLVAHMAASATSSRPEETLLLRDTLEGQAEALLESLEEELDPSLLSSALSYLLLSKHGLSVAELSSLLVCCPTIRRGSLRAESLSRDVTKFFRDLQRRLSPCYLRLVTVGDRSLLRLPCEQLRSAARNRYLLRDEERRLALRSSLREFWEAAETNFGGTRLNRHKLEELPQLCDVPLERFVFDWSWVFAKICGTVPDDLLEDIGRAEVPPERRAEVQLLVDFLHSASTALSYDGRQFFSQAHARLTLPTAGGPYPSLTRLLDMCTGQLLTSSLLCPVTAGCLVPVAAASPVVDVDEQRITCASLHRVKDNPDFVVSLCPTRNEVVVWNVYEQRPERLLSGVTQPRDIKFIDQHRAVILCNRELCIYDLDEGAFLVKIKGVMNQKMPYYDLHDADHVISLSRNRMYVNMMNLSTGDCVATFKVGEDRFLNSLLVSANGRICVCGDETQKPFPLLVWDLASRKLLYDLRIPHHDFVTSLSAITSDGHYVVCVCQEVSDPIPNFIIVYDLQNGTLFKKWKPDVSTCSVAISSEGGCVVTGLVDTSILVWDLTTGACRYTLQGHTAPVTLIRLDNNGHRCLTADLPRGRDPAIRLWDLSRGTCLASFMGDSPVICCELTANGQAVVLGMMDCPTILTLVLVEEGSSLPNVLPPKTHYGNLEYQGKQVNFGDKGG